MSRQQRLRNWLAFFLTGLVLSVFRIPFLSEAVQTNGLGLAAVERCAVPGGSFDGEMTPRNALLFAAAARCAGDETEMRQALETAFFGQESRIGLVRAAAPDDIALANSLIAALPGNPLGYFWLGDIFRLQSQPEAAIAAYQAGLALDPQSADDWYLLGRLLLDKGDQAGALPAFQQACRFVDQGKNGCPSAAGMLYDLGNYSEALAYYQATLDQLPDYPPAVLGSARSLIALGREDEALQLLGELAELGNPEAAEIFSELGKPLP